MHAHSHSSADEAHGRSASLRALKTALIATAALLVLQTAGGFLAGSLALLADAAHMLTDLGSLALAYTAARLAVRPATPRRTYGLYRVEILSTLLNSALLLVLSGFIVYEAVRRFREPEPIKPAWMLGFAVVALAGNLLSLSALRRPDTDSLNLRAAYLEVFADTLGSLGVLVAALVMLPTGWVWVDPLLSAVLGVAIVPRTLHVLKEALHVLLEGTPPGLDHARIQDELRALDGVDGVHDLHVWALTSGVPVLTAHVVVRAGAPCDDLLERITAHLKQAFAIDHATIQIEHEDRLRKEDDRF